MNTLDPAPLLARFPDVPDHLIAELLNVNVRTIVRWRNNESRIDPANADQYAVAAGLTPYELWPDLLNAAVAAVERSCETCGTTFLVTTPNKRFCSRKCREQNPAKLPALRAARAARARRRYQTDPAYREKKRSKVDAYREETRATFNASRRAYYVRNSEKERRYAADYRARRRNAA